MNDSLCCNDLIRFHLIWFDSGEFHVISTFLFLSCDEQFGFPKKDTTIYLWVKKYHKFKQYLHVDVLLLVNYKNIYYELGGVEVWLNGEFLVKEVR